MPISSLRIIHIQDYGMVITLLPFLHSLVPNFTSQEAEKLSLWGIYRTPAMKLREFLPADSYEYLSFYFPIFSEKVR